jgi:transposase
MLNDATCFKAVYIVCGFTDLRSGMDRLASIVEIHTRKKPYELGTLYLFCGRRTDRIKGLVWEGDGWLLLYKRLAEGRFQWPRNADEVQSLTPQQFRWLMEGLTIAPRKSVKPVDPPEYMA